MNRIMIRTLSCFIPNQKLRKKFRAHFDLDRERIISENLSHKQNAITYTPLKNPQPLKPFTIGITTYSKRFDTYFKPLIKKIRKSCHIDEPPFSPFAQEDIDILEQDIQDISPFLLKVLLEDKTTGCHIRFACDEYAEYGKAYTAEKEIFPELITGANTKIIQPRTAKSKNAQLNRTRKSAEVFTPSWICNEMNNHCDEEWFGRPNVFNTPHGHDWEPTTEPIYFKEDKKHKTAGWMRYVDSKRLEITCGEAPYLVSRYDTTTGVFLPIEKRIGLLDRKLRIVNENTENETEWFKWAKRAFEATYGYEYQGDNLLLARENLLWTFIDNFKFKFKKQPTLTQLKQVANVIAWNIWQMDGLTDTVPFSVGSKDSEQLELFNDLPEILAPTLCKIKDWRSDKVFNFQDLKKGNNNEI